jgi:hypothetical protein
MRILVLVFIMSGCTERNAATCLETHCPDPARPFCDVDGKIGGEENACIAVECAPGAFEACRGDAALTCNNAGNNYDLLECEFGCDSSFGGCKPCTTGQCEKHIVPKYLFTTCNQPTTNGDLMVTADTTLDTTNDQSCTSVVAQTGGPEICVVRNSTIRIFDNKTLRVIGPRAVAFVADRGVSVDGVLDVSADNGSSGPGGGFVMSGVTPEFGSEIGGGGAGGKTPGGHGADAATAGAAANGGDAMMNPSQVAALIGGARTTSAMFGNPGGGGGAVTVISCRGEVVVAGVIDAGGGGGDGEQPGGTKRHRASGGGAGGTIVLQGVDVTVVGTLVAKAAAAVAAHCSPTQAQTVRMEREPRLERLAASVRSGMAALVEQRFLQIRVGQVAVGEVEAPALSRSSFPRTACLR